MSASNVEAIYPLTPLQEGILFHTLLTPDSGVYFEQYHCTLEGAFDPDVFQNAWQHTFDRHQALRTLFSWKIRNQPLQVVLKHLPVRLNFQDWQTRSPEEQAEALEDYLSTDRKLGFDLTRAPLHRLAVFQTGPQTVLFCWSFHHILLDGWSVRLVLAEVLKYYSEAFQGSTPLKAAAPRYQDFVRWLKARDLSAAERYWRDLLSGIRQPTPLPAYLSRRSGPDRQDDSTSIYAEEVLDLSPETTKALENLAGKHRLTLNTVVQGAWAMLISRYSGETEILYGTTVSGRPASLTGADQSVGLFINTLPVRASFRQEDRLLPWLASLQSQLLETRQYEYSPLPKVQAWSELPAQTDLFETIVVFENHPASFSPAETVLNIRNPHYVEYSNYPLAFLAVPGERLQFILVYQSERFTKRQIQQMLDHLTQILEQFCSSPEGLLANISLLTPAEREKIAGWNDTGRPYPHERSIQSLIADWAEKTPHAPAVYYRGNSITYALLDRFASELAARLQQKGVGPNVLVGICAHRSIEMILAILAVLKAGGAYLPLDPTYPPDRLDFMLGDSGASLLLVQEKTAHLFRFDPQKTINISGMDDLEQVGDDPSFRESAFRPPEHHPDLLAYVIYTSGSTGKPKGVRVSQQNLVHSTTARLAYYPEEVRAFLLLPSFAFDSSMVAIFGTLCAGGALVLPEDRQEQDVVGLSALIQRHAVSHVLALPSLYSLMLELSPPESLKSLSAVIVAGEACPPDLPESHYRRLPDTALYNEYGPTEASVWCTVFHVTKGHTFQTVPIGKPIPNAQIQILDQWGNIVPAGIAGEIFVSGEGIAAGYHHRPALTAARFIPAEDNSGARMYRTGDIGRWLEDGNIEFLGRVDHQVKIRGYRIEIGEIENVLAGFPGISDSAVIAAAEGGRSDGNGNDRSTALQMRLVAYYSSETEDVPDAEEIKRHLRERLPEYMVPVDWVFMEQLPRLPNGKLDRKNLPSPLQSSRSKPHRSPQTETETVLVSIWTELLEVDSVSTDAGFFELGGDSLLMSRLLFEIRDRFSVDIPLSLLYEDLTVSGISERIDALLWASKTPDLPPDEDRDGRETFVF